MGWWREVVLSVLLGVLSNELSDVSPWLARRLVWWAASWWTDEPSQVAVYREEWTALTADRPGKLSKLATAVGFAAGGAAKAHARYLHRRFWRTFRARRRQRRLIATLLAIVVGLAGLGVLQQASGPPAALETSTYLSGTVTIGVSGNLPGWSTVTNGRWEGFEIEIGRWLAQRFGFTPRFVPMVASQGVQALQQGRVKLVISHLSITTARARDIGFAGPYFLDHAGVLMSPTKLYGQTTLAISRICAIAGTTGAAILRQQGASPQLETSLADCMRRFNDPADNVAGVVSDESILAAYWPTRRIGPAMFDGEHIPVSIERFGIGIPRDLPQLCRALSASIDDYLETSWDTSVQVNLHSLNLNEVKPTASDPNLCRHA